MAHTSTSPFECARAPELLGKPHAKVEQCEQFLPDFWMVVMTGGEIAAGENNVFPVLWDSGHVSTARGYAALASYLRRVRVYELPLPSPYGVQKLLEHLQAMPPGFQAGGMDAVDTVTGEKGGVTLQPFAIKLMAPGYDRPAAPSSPGGPPAPPAPGRPPGGPQAAPPGPPPGAGPAGGVAQVRVARATLRGDKDYHFTWTVELRETPAVAFTTIETIPLE